MDKEIKDKSELYYSLTKEVIDCLLKEEFEKLEGLFDKREAIINEVKDVAFKARDFAKGLKEAGISILEDEIRSLMEDNKAKIKEAMEELLLSKNANIKYKQQISVGSMFFSEKI